MNLPPLPDRKMLATGVSGVIAYYLIGLAGQYGYQLPAGYHEVVTFVVAWLMGYLVPPSKQDILKRLNDDLVRMAQDNPKIPVTKP